jgi:hypothetical protein
MFSWREVMTKRVAWFTGQASSSAVTPYKVYDVFNEDGDSFNLKDNTGDTRFCLKQGCAHICHSDWVFADIVEQTEKQEILEEDIVTTKQPKWSDWIENTTGKCPEGLKRKQKIKLKWSDGDKFNITNPHDAAWYFSKGAYPVDITHYKVKLKDVSEDTPKAQEKPKSKWTKNTGVRPVDGDVKVEIKTKDGDKECALAKHFSWGLCEAFCDIIKWRLAD